MPTWLAIQCVEETTPNVPMISGRVVKEGEAMMRARSLLGRDGRGYERSIAARARGTGAPARAALHLSRIRR